MTTVVESHIVIDETGIARVAGTGYKVRLLTQEYLRGDSPERIQRNHSDLTLGQIYSVIAYYNDHKEEMDADMDRREKEVERMRAEAGESPIAKRLYELGYLPHKYTLTDEQVYAEIAEAKAQQS
jgi:uncharacterized protein (DUF433 family)